MAGQPANDSGYICSFYSQPDVSDLSTCLSLESIDTSSPRSPGLVFYELTITRRLDQYLQRSGNGGLVPLSTRTRRRRNGIRAMVPVGVEETLAHSLALPPGALGVSVVCWNSFGTKITRR